MLSTVTYRETSPAANGAPPTAEKIVEMYRNNGNKLGVPDMRKFMKTMVAEVFLQDKFSAIHKCRGIWKQKPSDWDSNVPFADPNNAENASAGNKKPSKKTLKHMMSYLVQKYEETNPVKKTTLSYEMKLKDEKKPLAPATQTTLRGNICTQPSDWQEWMEDLKLETKQEEFDAASCAQEQIGPNIDDLLGQNFVLGTPCMEGDGAEPQEESGIIEATVDIGPEMDLVAYLDQSTGNQLEEEVGGSHANCNVQMQNTTTEIIHHVPAAQPVDYPPAVAAQQAPPPSRQMEGVPVSNAGVLDFIGGSVFGEGEQMDHPEYLGELIGQMMPDDIDLALDAFGNIIPAQSSNGALEDDQLQAPGNYSTTSQTSCSVAWTQHPTMEGSTYNQPMVETQSIPTFVMDFDEEVE